MPKTYPYIGPVSILAQVQGSAASILSVEQLQTALHHLADDRSSPGEITVTFVIGQDGLLRIADRRSEHVACAGGLPVASAGEMTFTRAGERLLVVGVTNQSTGYCPEPESWPQVAAALAALGLRHPGGFSTAMTFRRCPSCGQTILVKDTFFYCDVCGAELPADWNFD